MKGILPCCIINLPVRITHTLYNADKRENGLLCNNYCNKTLGIRTIVFGNSTVVPLLTCSKHVCAFILKKELNNTVVLSEDYFFKLRVSMQE